MRSDAHRKWARVAIASTAVASSLLLSSCATNRLMVESRMGKDLKATKASYIELNHVISKEQAQLINDYANNAVSLPIKLSGTVILPNKTEVLMSYSDLSIERVEGDGRLLFKFEDYNEGEYDFQLPKGNRADVIRLELRRAVYYKDANAIITELHRIMPQKNTLYFRIPEKKKETKTDFINEILCIIFFDEAKDEFATNLSLPYR